jgi:ketosteroid isomerase-like protein
MQRSARLVTLGAARSTRTLGGDQFRAMGAIRMRRLALAGVLASQFAFANPCLASDSAVDQAVAALKRAEAEWIRASLERDEAWLKLFFADELTVTHPTSGEVKTKAQEIADTIALEMAPEAMTLGDMHVRVIGQPPFLGIVTGIASETGGGGHLSDRDRSYLFTDTFLFRDGRWQLVASHSSRLPAK